MTDATDNRAAMCLTCHNTGFIAPWPCNIECPRCSGVTDRRGIPIPWAPKHLRQRDFRAGWLAHEEASGSA